MELLRDQLDGEPGLYVLVISIPYCQFCRPFDVVTFVSGVYTGL